MVENGERDDVVVFPFQETHAVGGSDEGDLLTTAHGEAYVVVVQVIGVVGIKDLECLAFDQEQLALGEAQNVGVGNCVENHDVQHRLLSEFPLRVWQETLLRGVEQIAGVARVTHYQHGLARGQRSDIVDLVFVL